MTDVDVNPHSCPHPEWKFQTDIPGDKEKECVVCGTTRTYIKKLYFPCCGYKVEECDLAKAAAQ